MEKRLNIELGRTYIQKVVTYSMVLSWQSLSRLTKEMRSVNSFAVKFIENRTPVLWTIIITLLTE